MKYFLTIIFVLFSFQSRAAELQSKDEIRAFVTKVMNFVEKGEPLIGLRLLKPYLVVPEQEFNLLLATINSQQPTINQRFGKTIGIGFIREEAVGESLLKITYIQKFNHMAMKWEFYFYKAENTWVMIKFNTDDKVTSLF